MTKNLNTNDILKAHGYGSDPRFVVIARWTAQHTFRDMKSLIDAVNIEFGDPRFKLGVLAKPRPYLLRLN